MSEAAQAQALPTVRIFAFGKRGYAFAAANLAATILDHNPAIDIEVRADRSATYVPASHRPGRWMAWDGPPPTRTGRPDPGNLKANILDHLPDGDSLVLDADTIALGDLGPWMARLQADGRPYITDVIDKGDGSGPIDYTPWATPEQIRAKMAIEGPATFYGLNTGWQFIRKVNGRGPDVLELAAAQWNRGTWSIEELQHRWGASMPDELLTASACSLLGYDPSWPDAVTFYGKELLTPTEIRTRFLLASMYGRGRGHGRAVRLQHVEAYDRILAQTWQRRGAAHLLKIHHVTNDKHLN